MQNDQVDFVENGKPVSSSPCVQLMISLLRQPSTFSPMSAAVYTHSLHFHKRSRVHRGKIVGELKRPAVMSATSLQPGAFVSSFFTRNDGTEVRPSGKRSGEESGKAVSRSQYCLSV